MLFLGEVCRLRMLKYYNCKHNYYKHLESDLNAQSCLYFQDLKSSKLLSSLLGRPNTVYAKYIIMIHSFRSTYQRCPRGSHHRCSPRKGVLRNFSKFTGKHLFQCLFLKKLAGLRAASLLQKRLWRRCFPENFTKFLRTPFHKKHLWWLLLVFYTKRCL